MEILPLLHPPLPWYKPYTSKSVLIAHIMFQFDPVELTPSFLKFLPSTFVNTSRVVDFYFN